MFYACVHTLIRMLIHWWEHLYSNVNRIDSHFRVLPKKKKCIPCTDTWAHPWAHCCTESLCVWGSAWVKIKGFPCRRVTHPLAWEEADDREVYGGVTLKLAQWEESHRSVSMTTACFWQQCCCLHHFLFFQSCSINSQLCLCGHFI